jgi:phosphoribosylcarboxyaminoimidazole (NCAIR) mutase
MGSQSDWATMKHAADTLDALGLAHDDRIVSAHRTPQRLYDFATTARVKRATRSSSRARAVLPTFPAWRPR